MKKIAGFAGASILGEYPVASGSGLINALPVGILGSDGSAILTANAPGPGGGGLFNQGCYYTLASGIIHNLGPSPTTGTFAAGVTNVFVVTPNASGSTIDSIIAPGTNGFSIILYNPSLTLSLTILDKNNAGTSGTAGNLIAIPNPNALAANAIAAVLAPQSAQRLTYYVNQWICA